MTRKDKIARSMLCHLCGHDWLDHNFERPVGGLDAACSSCDDGLCRHEPDVTP